MAASSPYRPFSTCHPVVPLACVLPTLLMAMLVVQPVYVGISLAGGLLLSSLVLGPSAILARLRWQLPFLALIVLLNPLFVRAGSTVLFELGPLAPRLEALLYGLCMGATLASVLLWFECCGQVLDADGVRDAWGGRLSSLALVTSMTFQLLPRLLYRVRQAEGVLAACTAAEGTGGAPGEPVEEGGPATHAHWALPVRRRVRSLGVVLGWALEDSLERADSMRARGWGALPHRSFYARQRLRAADVTLALAFTLLGVLNALLARVALGQWHFYPQMPRLMAWWGYLPFVLQVLLPSLAVLADRVSWRSR